MSFIKEFSRIQRKCYQIAKSKGFHNCDYDSVNPVAATAQSSQGLMLIVSELSEALEALRHGNPPDNHIPEFSGLEAELADAVIRICDFSEARKLRLAQAIVAKMAYNSTRAKMNGGKKF